MTEIPEHLLKRAQARRAALTGAEAPAEESAAADASAPAAAPAASAPAKTPQRAPLPTLDDEPAPPPPDIPVVAAAKSRKRVPYWAAPVLALLPLWAIIYQAAVTTPDRGETDPLVIGSGVFVNSCQGCHAAGGAGGASGAQLAEGHTIETFSDPLTMVHWVGYGFGDAARPDGTYGDVNRPQLTGAMPGFQGQLSPEEIASVVIYVRQELGGDLYDPEAERGFTAEAFEEDPAAVVTQVEETLALGPGPDPDVESVDRPE